MFDGPLYLNSSAPMLRYTCERTEQESLEALEPMFVKHMRLREAMQTLPEAAVKLLATMSSYLEGHHRSVLVDFKVYDMLAGQHTCIPGWHIDTVVDPRHCSRPENHIIYTNVFGTEFVSCPVRFDENLKHFKDVTSDIPEDNVLQANPNSIYQYGRFHLHRGPQVTHKCRRVLMRVTETDVIK